MRNRVVVPFSAITLAAAVVLWTPVRVLGQEQAPTGALVNQGTEQTVEAARKASPRSGDDALKFFQEEGSLLVFSNEIQRYWTKPNVQGSVPL